MGARDRGQQIIRRMRTMLFLGCCVVAMGRANAADIVTLGMGDASCFLWNTRVDPEVRSYVQGFWSALNYARLAEGRDGTAIMEVFARVKADEAK